MMNALRLISVRTQSSSSSSAPLFSSALPINQVINRKATGLRFAQGVSDPNQNKSSDKMDKPNKPEPESKSGDAMSSLGEGYATRADEEGFGGIYGGNQYLSKDDEDKIVHGNAPEYDHSQGSEVKEKEKGRNQEKVAS